MTFRLSGRLLDQQSLAGTKILSRTSSLRRKADLVNGRKRRIVLKKSGLE
jgi:hypothetical protein